MKNTKYIKITLLMIGLLTSGLALAHGARVGVGVYLGGPYYPYPYYPYPYYAYPGPYYAYPPVVIRQAPPPVYIEQGTQPAQQSQQLQQPQQQPIQDNFWYHCDNPEGYYPYIKECPGGWQKVTPEPPK